jgi:integrase
MAKTAAQDRLLPQNARSIQKAIRATARQSNKVVEFRIANARSLVLHVMPTGRATWYAHYDIVEGKNRRRRKLKLGRFDELSLADALIATDEVRSGVRRGDDPVNTSRQRRQGITFGELAELRLHDGRALRPSTVKDYRHLLNADILPAIGLLPAEEVARQHIIELLDKIVERGSTRRADTARAIVSSVYSFGTDRGLVSENPASGLKNRHDYQPRSVVLAADDIRTIWQAVDDGDAAMSLPIRQIVKLALLTGQRRAEIAGLRRSDVTLTGACPAFIITQERAKNATTHSVPLSEAACQILSTAMSSQPDQPFVFPGLPGQAILPGSVTKAFVRTRDKLQTGRLRVHDLRRTVASLMASYGIPRDVRERILNHGGKRKGGITEGTYTWYDYDAEKRAALDLWADALACIVAGGDAEIEGYYSRLARLKASDKVRIG